MAYPDRFYERATLYRIFSFGGMGFIRVIETCQYKLGFIVGVIKLERCRCSVY